MGRYGNAYYCDKCSCEIVSGACCTDCDPKHGSAGIVYTFVVTETPEAQANLENLVASSEEVKPWWKLW